MLNLLNSPFPFRHTKARKLTTIHEAMAEPMSAAGLVLMTG